MATKPEVKWLFERPRHSWEDSIELILNWYKNVKCINLTQGSIQWQALVNLILNLWVPLKMWNLLTIQVTIMISRNLLH
jgi:hypothetical protein